MNITEPRTGIWTEVFYLPPRCFPFDATRQHCKAAYCASAVSRWSPAFGGVGVFHDFKFRIPLLTKDYKWDVIEELMTAEIIHDYREHHTDVTVDYEIQMAPETLREWRSMLQVWCEGWDSDCVFLMTLLGVRTW